MKPYKDLSIIDKAELLHQWFPNEMNHFISFAEKIARNTIKKEGNIKKPWHSKKLDPILWHTEANVLLEKIDKHRQSLVEDSTFFANKVFKGYLDFFPEHCLLEYTLISPNQKMIDAIEFLFQL